MRKDTVENVIKIVKCLEGAEEGWLWIREVGRRTGLHHKTVSRLINHHLTMFVDEQSLKAFNVRMIKLKPSADLGGIFRFLAIKDRIDGV